MICAGYALNALLPSDENFNGKKLVRRIFDDGKAQCLRGLHRKYAQSIIGAAVTLQLLAGSLDKVLETASVADSGP